MNQTGRSGSGNLRNFKKMSDEKFAGVLADVLAEDNDPEAIAAVGFEASRRGADFVQGAIDHTRKQIAEAREQVATTAQALTSDISKLAMNAKEASSIDEALSHIVGEAILEPKLDGIRLLVNITENGVKMYARSGNPKGPLPRIADELLAAFPVGTWLDAEAVAFNDDGSQDWGGAQSCLGSNDPQNRDENIRLIVFDIMQLNSTDLRAHTLSVRRSHLERIFEEKRDDLARVMLVCQLEATQENHDAIVAAGYEGTMIKDLSGRYLSGKRGWAWTKCKHVSTADVVVMGYKDGKGKFTGMIGAVVFGQYLWVPPTSKNPPGSEGTGWVLVERGACSGMDDALRADITRRQDELIGTVMEISYRTFMVDRKTGLPNYRHPQFERFRWDKNPAECTVEAIGKEV